MGCSRLLVAIPSNMKPGCQKPPAIELISNVAMSRYIFIGHRLKEPMYYED